MTAALSPAGIRVDRRVSPVLVGCEESQTITKALRDAGIEAYSCDLAQTRGNAAWHYQQDILEVIPTRRWGLIILHPDCTAMAVSGNRWYGRGMPMHHKREQAIEWTVGLWELAKQYGDKVALENPVSVISSRIRKPDQIIQPWQFGHGETKATCLWLKGLPKLTPTNVVEGREARVHRMPPGPDRWKERSRTYQGVADAMAAQWGQAPNA